MLLVGVIDGFVDEEVELHSMQPVHGLFIGTIEHFGNTNAKFGGFGGHWWGWGNRERSGGGGGSSGRGKRGVEITGVEEGGGGILGIERAAER